MRANVRLWAPFGRQREGAQLYRGCSYKNYESSSGTNTVAVLHSLWEAGSLGGGTPMKESIMIVWED
jgi:hypothetical protein